MKLKAIVLGIIAAAVLFACYPLVSPIQPRTNPNDENSTLPVAEPDSFTAVYNTEGEVNLSWTPIDITGEQRRDGYLVIRKVGSAPTNVLDGTYAGDFGPQDNGSGYSDFVDDGSDGDFDEGVPAGFVSYYGLFAYYSDEENPPSVNNTDESGNLTDTEYFNFAGPVVASVSVPEERTIQLDILEEWVIDSSDVWTENSLSAGLQYIAVDDYNQNLGSILKFDTTDIEGLTIESASLSLTKANTNAETCDILIDYIINDWTAYSTMFDTEIAMSSFVDDGAGIQGILSGINEGATTTFDDQAILDMVQNWADGDENNGLRILLNKNATGLPPNDFVYQFYTSSAGIGSQPTLEVTYMHYPE